MHFLVVDDRFGTPIYAFLELDPTGEPGFPGFRVRAVDLERTATPADRLGPQVPSGSAVGRDPGRLDSFREFRTDRAAAGAGFILIEPRYVGPSWQGYLSAFRPAGEKLTKRPGNPLRER